MVHPKSFRVIGNGNPHQSLSPLSCVNAKTIMPQPYLHSPLSLRTKTDTPPRNSLRLVKTVQSQERLRESSLLWAKAEREAKVATVNFPVGSCER